MTLIAAVGQAQTMDAREAGMQAAYQALNNLGTVTPSLCMLIVPHRYDPIQVINGAASMLSNIPTLGFSVSSGITQSGLHSHSVIVALLAGDSLLAETHWFPTYSQSSAETATRINQLIGYEQNPVKQVLVFGDGLNANTEEFCDGLRAGLPVFGGLSSGDLMGATTFQIAGTQSGSGALAAAFLRGNFRLGIGYGHGWYPVGSDFRVTRSRGFWLRTLDGKPAFDTYARLFGQEARIWATPPLNTMCRIYPLGFEQDFSDKLLVRAPIRVEADGSLRMNSNIPEGSNAYLMVGSPADCEKVAIQATRDALNELDEAKPVMALVLMDSAWQMLLQAQPERVILAVQEILGADVPIAGGYTLGQLLPPDSKIAHPRFTNQHIVVALFGEPKTK